MLFAVAAIAAAFTLPARAESMTCTDATTGEAYSATLVGGKIKLKSPTWSANLTVVERSAPKAFTTKVNKNNVYTYVSFEHSGVINYFRKGNSYAYRMDRCRSGGQVVQTYRAPQAYSVLDGIKQKCFAEWPGDYRMQKYCIDQQIEAYNALQRY